MSKITQQTAQQIIDEYVAGSSTYELQEKYGIWSTTIGNIVRGKSWKKCQRPDNIKKIIDRNKEKTRFKKGRTDELHQSYPDLTYRQKETLVGSMLGDGSLSKTNNSNPNSYFTKKQCNKYREYVYWHHDEFFPFNTPVKETFSKENLDFDKEKDVILRNKTQKHLCGYVFRTCSHPFFTELRSKWYPQGKKIIPLDLKLTPLTIAIWFCDDGHNSYSHRESVFCTQSFSPEEVQFLCDKLKEFDIKARVRFAKYKSGKKPIIKVNSRSYDNLIELIKPFIVWDCMSHKCKWRRAKKQWEFSGKFTEQQVLDIKEKRKHISAKDIAKEHDVHVNTIYAIVSGRSWTHLE